MGKKSRVSLEIRKSTEESKLDPTVPRLPPRPSSEEYKSTGDNDLFDNPMVRAASSALSDEDKERYKRLGEALYADVDFETCKSLNNIPAPFVEAVQYLELQLNSGLHPSMLEDNDKILLKDAYGAEWYKKWGYIEADLTDIVTF